MERGNLSGRRRQFWFFRQLQHGQNASNPDQIRAGQLEQSFNANLGLNSELKNARIIGWILSNSVKTESSGRNRAAGLQAGNLQAQAELDATSSKESSRNSQDWVQQTEIVQKAWKERSSPRMTEKVHWRKQSPAQQLFPGRKHSKNVQIQQQSIPNLPEDPGFLKSSKENQELNWKN